jgi:site-specific DNA recombinase
MSLPYTQADKAKCFIYLRRSQDREDRQQLSLEKQDTQVQQIIQRGNLEPFYLPAEERSAKFPGRPVFNDMMSRIESGEATNIAVWALSRLSRNPIDGGRVIYALDTGKLHAIHTPSRTYRNTPDDKMVLAIELALAKKNNDDLSVQVKEGFEAKRSHGQYPGPAPLGYRNAIIRPGERNIIPDPETADKVLDCFEYASLGIHTLNDIWNHAWEIKLLSRSGKRLGKQTVAEILQRRAYMGLFKYGGNEWHKGSYEPLVTPELFDKVQIAMGWKKQDEDMPKQPSTTSGRNYPFKGLLLCNTCKFNVTAYTKSKKLARSGKTAEYFFYTCTKKSQDIHCIEPQISAPLLDKAIQRRMGEFEISEQDALECKDWVYKQYSSYVSKHDQNQDVWLRDKTAAESALNILDEKLEMGTMSDERYKLRADVHLQTIKAMEQKLNGTHQEADRWLELSNQTFSEVVNIGEVFEMANDEEKRKLMKLLGSNWYLGDKDVTLTPRKPFDVLHVDYRKSLGETVWRARPDLNR